MSTSRARARVLRARLLTTCTALALVTSLLVVTAPAATAVETAQTPGVASAGVSTSALVQPMTLAGFTPGNIINDAMFYNRYAMTEAQIQAFLDSKVRSCRSGYTCLKDYYDTTRTVAPNAMCGGYDGGWGERASTIIYRVAQACGINPQVILVTLQKEQGLVTHTEPSASRYRIAMGQGCPDTAACDTRYYGFFNQVMGAAWQLKRYANPPGTSNYFTWYPVGRVSNIGFNPNAACGSSPVLIQNQATASLYYYTPYQPNAAALAAGYGLGDGCSAYGNRNFYNYFTDWFGSTQRDVGAEITAEYLAQGGAASLGQPTSAVLTLTQNGGGYARAYEYGSVYWSPGVGAKTVRSGPLLQYYFSLGGADGTMGWPQANQQALTAAGAAGTAQAFGGGSVYASTTGTFIVREPMRSGYFSVGGASGVLAWPKGEQVCASSICRQEFVGGSVVSSAAGAFAVVDPVRAGLDAAGGVAGAWGPPVSAAAYVAASGGGYGQAFTKGSAYYAAGGQAFFVSGAVRDRYFASGGAAGSLGFPIGAQQCANSSTCQQQFQFGWIMWTAAGGARIGDPAIDAAAAAAAGVLGARTSALMYYSYNGGGFAEGFANGAVFYKRSLGAFAVSGSVQAAYFASGGAAGRYGWPTSAMSCANGTCSQGFEGGLLVTTGAGTFSVVAPVRAAFEAAGGVAGSWGSPQSGILAVPFNGGGSAQVFANGSVYFRAGGSAFFVSGQVRDAYFARSGAAGLLGFPTGAAVCDGSTACRQQFDAGWILWTAADGSRVGDPAIDAAYAASSAVLGARTPGSFVRYAFNGGGFAESFANGAIFFKPSVGAAYAVTGSVRDAYFAAGGAAGRYGWPTSAMTCANGTCTQSFQGGVVAAAG